MVMNICCKKIENTCISIQKTVFYFKSLFAKDIFTTFVHNMRARPTDIVIAFG